VRGIDAVSRLALVSAADRERLTSASTASMPPARPRHRGQAPQPCNGAAKPQGLTATIAVAASSRVPSIAAHNALGRSTNFDSTHANVSIAASATPGIYTNLTDATMQKNFIEIARSRNGRWTREPDPSKLSDELNWPGGILKPHSPIPSRIVRRRTLAAIASIRKVANLMESQGSNSWEGFYLMHGCALTL
jgi:hypothetical protein